MHAASPEESKFSDSSASTVRSCESEEKLSPAGRKEQIRKTRTKLLKELKSAKMCRDSKQNDFRSMSVSGEFARESSARGRSTALDKMSSGAATMSLRGDEMDAGRGFEPVCLSDRRPNSAMGMGGKYERVKKRGLDRMSRSLADEDPSVLLYASPTDIAGKLGLGRTKSFRALNENITAVKLRQNVPEKQKKKFEVSRKVDKEISAMKDDRALERIASRRSVDSETRGRDSCNGSDEHSIFPNDKTFSRSSGDFCQLAGSLSPSGGVALNTRRRFSTEDEQDVIRGRSASRGFSAGFGSRELHYRKFSNGMDFEAQRQPDESRRRQRRRESYHPDDDSYFTDGEYNQTRGLRRRADSASMYGNNGCQIPETRASRDYGQSRNFQDMYALPLHNAYGLPSATSPRTLKKVSLGNSVLHDDESLSDAGSHSPGSWGSRSFESDDVSLVRYGIEDSASNFQKILPIRSSNVQTSPTGSTSKGMVRGRQVGRVDVRGRQEDVAFSVNGGRMQSRVFAQQRRCSSVDLRGFDVSEEAVRRPRSSSRLRTSDQMQLCPSQEPQMRDHDDDDISIDRIISKYLYRT